jgi:hypothetical protein
MLPTGKYIYPQFYVIIHDKAKILLITFQTNDQCCPLENIYPRFYVNIHDKSKISSKPAIKVALWQIIRIHNKEMFTRNNHVSQLLSGV